MNCEAKFLLCIEYNKELEDIFVNVNSDKICMKPLILKRLNSLAETVDILDFRKRLYLKSRMYFRLNHLNNNLLTNVYKYCSNKKTVKTST